MGISTSTPATRRGYLSESELEQFADITVTDTDEGIDRIEQAEELIDAYVGAQEKFFNYEVTGKATGGSTSTLTLQTTHQNSQQNDYYKGMQLEIIGGTGINQITKITGSTYAGVLTFETVSTALDSTSIYKIYQLGKFPRIKDYFYDSESGDNKYYKYIPEAVRRAVAAQVEYMVEMGDAYFETDKTDYESESVGDYSYTKKSGSSIDRLISPKSKQLLRGIMNRKGAIIR